MQRAHFEYCEWQRRTLIESIYGSLNGFVIVFNWHVVFTSCWNIFCYGDFVHATFCVHFWEWGRPRKGTAILHVIGSNGNNWLEYNMRYLIFIYLLDKCFTLMRDRENISGLYLRVNFCCFLHVLRVWYGINSLYKLKNY